MGGITPELADVVRAIAGPDLAAALAARLGTEFAALAPAANTEAEQRSSSTRGDTATHPRVLAGVVAPDTRPTAPSPEETAARPDLADDELRALLDLDDPHVDARLFTNPRVDDAERRRMLTGVRRDGRPGRVGAPLLDLLWTTDLRRLAARLPLAITSGDPGVATVIVSRLDLRTEAGRLRLITGVWHRYGAAEARRVLHAASFPAAPTEAIEKALASPGGLDELRTRLAAEEDPEHLCASLRALTDDPRTAVEQLAAEGTALPWEALLRDHAADPLPHELRIALAELPDCPRELLLGLIAAGLPADRESAWLDAALTAGRLTPTDLLTSARPAARSLALLAADTHRDRRARWHTPAADPDVSTLVRTGLGADPDAWAVAVRLLPDFEGSLPELLTTATAATHREAV